MCKQKQLQSAAQIRTITHKLSLLSTTQKMDRNSRKRKLKSIEDSVGDPKKSKLPKTNEKVATPTPAVSIFSDDVQCVSSHSDSPFPHQGAATGAMHEGYVLLFLNALIILIVLKC